MCHVSPQLLIEILFAQINITFGLLVETRMGTYVKNVITVRFEQKIKCVVEF
jgi:hypothetical protein